MAIFTPTSHEFIFPEATLGTDRASELARQAHVLEFAAHMALDYSGKFTDAQAGWLTLLTPQLSGTSVARPTSLEQAQLHETQITAAPFFNARIESKVVDDTLVSSINQSLRIFDHPAISSEVGSAIADPS
jgi:hypothetical protein